MTFQDAKLKLEKYGQEHVLAHFDTLSEADKEALLFQIDDTDFSVLEVQEGEDSPTPYSARSEERGGEEVCIFNGNMWNYYGIDQRTVSYMEIQHRSARAGVTYFDNISLTRTEKVYEA